MEGPERIVDVKEFSCPFCGAQSVVKTKDVVSNGSLNSGMIRDEWTCPSCGSANSIFDDADFAWMNDLNIEKIELNTDIDVVELFLFSKSLVQKKEFQNAAKLMRHILALDDYFECECLLGKIEKVIQLKDLLKYDVDIESVLHAMNLPSYTPHYFLNKKNGKVELLSEFSDEGKIEQVSPSKDHILIAPLPSSKTYLKMHEFIEMVDEQSLKNELSLAIRGADSFCKFKDVLAGYTGTVQYREMWFDFYNSFLWDEAMDFLISSYT